MPETRGPGRDGDHDPASNGASLERGGSQHHSDLLVVDWQLEVHHDLLEDDRHHLLPVQVTRVIRAEPEHEREHAAVPVGGIVTAHPEHHHLSVPLSPLR